MSKKNKRDYDSTTPEPVRPEIIKKAPVEDPDKTKKKEKNDPTRYTDPDITSIPGNPGNDKKNENDNEEGSILNRTEV